MGCIGFPNHPVLEITSACNLRCSHCHARGGKPSPDELSTQEMKGLISSLAEVNEFKMLVFTGGEPMLRKDIYELAEFASGIGFTIVIATNGTLIDRKVAHRLKRCGVVALAVGLDGSTAELHDRIRGREGAFELALRCMRACRQEGLALQINITAMQQNYDDLPHLLRLAEEVRADIVLLYHLIPIGRGNPQHQLTMEQYAKVMELVARWQERSSLIIEPTCAPQYFPHLLQRAKKNRLWLLWAEKFFKGCAAGRGFCYIKPNGDVWACPFLPVSLGNVRTDSFTTIWEGGHLLTKLRNREKLLRGDCLDCPYKAICGGCRARAFAATHDVLMHDPLCFIRSEEKAQTHA